MLRRSSAEWDILFNARAGPQLAMLYAEDAYTMPPNGEKISGRAALRNDFDALFEAFDARHETQVDEYVIGGDRAVELAHYTLTLEPRAGGNTVVEKGRRVICWRRKGPRWEIAWEMWNTQGPPQESGEPQPVPQGPREHRQSK
jgi:ketosteroid isomerase-like protein